MKSISTINPANMENMECLIIKARASSINLKVGVSLNRGASLRFVSLLALQTCWATIESKNMPPASSALTLVLP